jgi:hypothetical protein
MPAFPCNEEQMEGVTIRALFAALIRTGLAANYGAQARSIGGEELCCFAVAEADRLIKELQRPE